jgi:hypothetical protein
MFVASAVFLRWLPHHGWFVGILVLLTALTAIAVNLTQKRRFHRAIGGINQERMRPDIAATAAVAASVLVLSLMGIFTVLFLPLNP